MRLTGQGEPGMNGPPSGDLLRVHIQPHPLLQIAGNDGIEIELPVAPWEPAADKEATFTVPPLLSAVA